MIGVPLRGQLGNQMFRYAGARVQAERLGVPLVISTKVPFFSVSTFALGRMPDFELFDAFPDLKIHALSRFMPAVNRLRSAGLIPKSVPFKALFHPKQNLDMGEWNEMYDERIWDVEPRTLVDACFFSEQYFQGWESDIRGWFSPPTQVAKAVDQNLATLPHSPDDMVAVHVRLTDYLVQNDINSDAQTGWALPPSYYEDALALVGQDTPIALFSDDVQRAKSLLPREPAWTTAATAPVVDLFSMARFRNLIVANSTFSWWSGWLNADPKRRIIAPEFFIGFRHKRWVPNDIKVKGWHYIEPQTNDEIVSA
ncbi:MAG: alpha-1,2-fucosyltransferase [Pseudomonadota bacterium]